MAGHVGLLARAACRGGPGRPRGLPGHGSSRHPRALQPQYEHEATGGPRSAAASRVVSASASAKAGARRGGGRHGPYAHCARRRGGGLPLPPERPRGVALGVPAGGTSQGGRGGGSASVASRDVRRRAQRADFGAAELYDEHGDAGLGDAVGADLFTLQGFPLDGLIPAPKPNLWDWRLSKLSRVLAFIIPAMVVMLADSLMSLVDTLCVGQFSSTLELAALGPNTVIFNLASYLFFSVGLSTNTLVGRFLKEGEPALASRVVSQAMLFGVTAGSLMTIFLECCGPALIQAIGTAPHVVGPALAYLRIRALAAPLVICINAAMSGLMAQKNSIQPSMAVGAAGLVNMFLDIVLIRVFGLGLQGAAVATLVGQVICLALLLQPYFRRESQVRLMPSLPTQRDLQLYTSCAGPIFVVSAAKNTAYCLIQSAATAMHFVLVAAHQALWSLFAVATMACCPVEQAALAFLPAARTRFERRELIYMLLGVGLAIGLAGGAVCVLPALFAPHWFAADVLLWQPIQSVVPQAFAALALAGVDVAMNGILLAEGQAAYLARAMLVNLGVTAAYFAAVGRSSVTMSHVWWGLVVFFVVRAGQGVAKLREMGIGTERGVSSAWPKVGRAGGAQAGGRRRAHAECSGEPREGTGARSVRR